MSLMGAYDPNNIFAKILRGEAPCIKVFEDDAALAFLDIFPRSTGHTLVIPKVAARNLFELPAAAVGPYMERVQLVAHGVRRALSPDGVILVQFNGAPAGQTVFHLHMHIIPRFDAEMLYAEGQSPKADASALAVIGEKIRAAIAA
jgi:histidine triad (HIT) family protein